MDKRLMDYELRSTEAFLLHVASVFTPEDANFSPYEGAMTVAQQLAHSAQTVEWYLQGASRPEGFDLDFEAHFKEVLLVTSLEAASAWLKRSIEAARKYLAETSDSDLDAPLPEGLVMPGVPRKAIFLGIIDHCAHHRGALTQYARALGKVAPMAYEPQLPWR